MHIQAGLSGTSGFKLKERERVRESMKLREKNGGRGRGRIEGEKMGEVDLIKPYYMYV